MPTKKARVINPVLQALMSAPFDDEPVTSEERKAVDEARKQMSKKSGLTTDEVRKALELL